MTLPAALPTPIGRQREVLYLPAQGRTVVLGTAGSGKTVLAILRARYLSDRATDHHGRTLLLTFNRCLVTYMKDGLAGDLNPVTVETYHRFARGYLNARGLMSPNAICEPGERRQCIAAALGSSRTAGTSMFVQERSVEFFEEEFSWMQRHGIRTMDRYRSGTRLGRASVRVPRADRPAVFEVFDRYLAQRRERGRKYDWDDLASAVLCAFESDTTPRLYRHVIVDEGQDFSPEMLRSLAAAVPEDGTLTFFGDTAQQIYGHRMSWRDAGIEAPKIHHFKENYRNSKPIASLALAIAAMPFFRDDPDLVRPKIPTAEGPDPVLVSFPGDEDELRLVVSRAVVAAASGSTAVLFRTRDQENRVVRLLPESSVRLHRDLARWPSDARLFYGTYHAAKGLEFDTVFLPLLADRHWPDPQDVERLGPDEAKFRNARLLYVGITRARSDLVLTYSGRLTPLLSGAAEFCVQLKHE